MAWLMKKTKKNYKHISNIAFKTSNLVGKVIKIIKLK